MFNLRSRLFAASLCAAALQTAAAEPIVIPGSTVVIDAPDGWIPADRFAGLMNLQTGGSILMIQLPSGGFAELSEALQTPGALAQRGVVMENWKPIMIDGHDGLIGTGLQIRQDQFVGKIILLVDGPEKTLQFAGNIIYPDEEFYRRYFKADSADIISILNTVRFGQDAAPRQVRFSVTPAAEFEEIEDFSVGPIARTFRRAMGDPDDLKDDHALSVLGSLDETCDDAPTDRRAFSTSLFQTGRRMLLPTPIDTQPVTQDGLEGFVIYGTGIDRKHGGVRYLWQMTLFDACDYWVLLGFAPIAESDEAQAAFETMAATFTRN